MKAMVFGPNSKEITIFRALPAQEEKLIQRHLSCLKKYRKGIYQSSHKRQAQRHLAEIDKQAQKHFERLIEGTKQTQGI